MRGRRALSFDILPFRRFHFGPLAAVETIAEYQYLLLAGRPSFALAALGRRVLGRLQLREHGPVSLLHRGQIREFCVLEIDVQLARRLLLALVTQIGIGFARDGVAQRRLLRLGNGIPFGGSNTRTTGTRTGSAVLVKILLDFDRACAVGRKNRRDNQPRHHQSSTRFRSHLSYPPRLGLISRLLRISTTATAKGEKLSGQRLPRSKQSGSAPGPSSRRQVRRGGPAQSAIATELFPAQRRRARRNPTNPQLRRALRNRQRRPAR